jgi:hypothetical protein
VRGGEQLARRLAKLVDLGLQGLELYRVVDLVERMGGWEDGRMGGWEDGRMGGWEDGRMGGWEGDLDSESGPAGSSSQDK